MIIWIDAQLSPEIAAWIRKEFSVQTYALRDIGLRDATDLEIFFAAREEGTVLMTKDSDFIRLLEMHGSPPHVIWLTCGNTSNKQLKKILSRFFQRTLLLIEEGESLVEISDLR